MAPSLSSTRRETTGASGATDSLDEAVSPLVKRQEPAATVEMPRPPKVAALDVLEQWGSGGMKKRVLLVVMPSILLAGIAAGCGCGARELSKGEYVSKLNAMCPDFGAREREIGEPQSYGDLVDKEPQILFAQPCRFPHGGVSVVFFRWKRRLSPSLAFAR
jgi:hypothetical protein